MKTQTAFWTSVGILFTAIACVTVNVNFPESAVQKATDDYVRELYRAKERGKPATPAESKPAKTSWLIHDAWADADATFTVSTNKALTIRERLAARLPDILAQKRAGILGEGNDGALVLKEPGKLKDLLKKKIEKLVADENKDRDDLYDEVVKANSIAKGKIKEVRRSFARSFQAESPSGTLVQDTDGKWEQKP